MILTALTRPETRKFYLCQCVKIFDNCINKTYEYIIFYFNIGSNGADKLLKIFETPNTICV